MPRLRIALLACAVAAGALALLWSSPGTPGAGAQSCALCVDFFTKWDPDGPGGSGGATRMHRDIIANVPYALDVNGSQPPLPLGLLPVVPGYEVKVTVAALDAEKPTIRIEKLINAPASLPLRIEVVSGDSSDAADEKTTFGYDTLDSTAPRNFVAMLDISDHDGNPATDRALVNINIGGAGQSLTVVNEQFKGRPQGPRTERHVRRLAFRATPTEAVPSMLGLLVESKEGSQKVRLETDRRSAMDFEISEPGGDPMATGEISELPFFSRILLRDQDVDGDSHVDKLVDYETTNRVGHLAVHTFDDGTTTDIAVDMVPKEAHVIYGDPPGTTRVEYHASERAGRAQVDVDDGTTQFMAAMENLPVNIDELVHTETTHGGTVEYHADAIADLAEVEVTQGAQNLLALVEGVPANVEELTYATPPDLVNVDYLADSVVPHAEVTVEDVIDEPAPDPDHRQTIAAAADGFPEEVHFDIDSSTPTTAVDYSASSEMTRVAVSGDDEAPFFGRAKALDLLLEQLPLTLHGEFGEDSVLVDALGGEFGLAEFAARHARPTLPVPDPLGDPEQDGLKMDEPLSGPYLLFARVHDLQGASADTKPDLDAMIDTNSSPLRSFDVDLHYPWEDRSQTQTLTGSIDTLRPSTEVFVGTEDAETNLVSYSDAGTGTGPTIALDGANLEWLPAGENGVQAEEFHVDLTGMPRNLDFRQSSDDDGLPMEVDASGAGAGATLNRADVQITSGPDERLPEAQNGFYQRDLASKFVLFARVRNLDSFRTDRPDEEHFELDLDAPSAANTRLDIERDVRDELWVGAGQENDGTEVMFGALSSLPPNIVLRSTQTEDGTELAYDADDIADLFQFTHFTNYRGPDVPVGYHNAFLNANVPTSFEPSDFDPLQSLSLDPMPRFFRVCQIPDNNDCTQSVFTGGMFDEFSPESANGGSIRFQASPRTQFDYNDHSTVETTFQYFRPVDDPGEDCQEGEVAWFPISPTGCLGGAIKPGLATADVSLAMNELSIQTHQEDAGFVGSLVGYPDQGYIAMHTGWAADVVGCVDTLVELGEDETVAEVICANPLFSLHGHHTPPLDARVTGSIVKDGELKVPSESGNDWESNFGDVKRLGDSVNLQFGNLLALDHRVFEYDPDELIFAKTYNGHSYCESDTQLEGNGTDFTGNYCEGGEAALLGDP